MNIIYNINIRRKEKNLSEKLNVTQVAAMLGTSVNAINVWYRFKKANPDDELSKLLPEYEMKNLVSGRYWNKDDIDKLAYFKSKIKKGCKGQLSSIYQKYRKKG